MSEEIKPCPFCGGEASVFCGSSMNNVRWVECEDCGAEGPTLSSYEYVDYRAEAIAAWNRRADRWIPVSERLPEKKGLYLCCNQGEAWIDEWVGAPDSSFVATKFITAWRPLPRPYEEGSEEGSDGRKTE